MKIITAIGDPYLNNKIRQYGICDVIGQDIQYQDGIIEILEEKEDINVIILSNNLPIEYDFKILINNILNKKENIEIIVFLKEKNEYLESFLNSKNIYKIYYLNQNNYDIFLNNFCINSEKNKIEITNEIKDFKEFILNNKLNNYNKKDCLNKNKILKKTNKLIKENYKSVGKKFEKNMEYLDLKYKNNIINNKIITISGNYGVGKSIVSLILSKYIEQQNKRVLLIDFDINNNSIKYILGLKNSNKNTNIDNLVYLINNISNNFSIMCGLDSILTKIHKVELYKLNDFFCEIKESFDFIILDISSNIELNYIERILNLSNKIIFLLESNLSEIKKAKKILEIYKKDWNIENEKIKLLFNKLNQYHISENIIKEIFFEYELFGNINYNEKYNLFINKNLNNLIFDDEYKKIYEKL